MQAATLTFVIVASQIGTASGQISRTTGAALLAAGLLSAALFPALAVKLLPAEPAQPAQGATNQRPGSQPSWVGEPESFSSDRSAGPARSLPLISSLRKEPHPLILDMGRVVSYRANTATRQESHPWFLELS